MARGRRGTPAARAARIYTDALDREPTFREEDARVAKLRDEAVRDLAYAWVSISEAFGLAASDADRSQLETARTMIRSTMEHLGTTPERHQVIRDLRDQV